jgi:hypothetical protein
VRRRTTNGAESGNQPEERRWFVGVQDTAYSWEAPVAANITCRHELQPPLLQPANAEQIHNSHPEAAADAVFR